MGHMDPRGTWHSLEIMEKSEESVPGREGAVRRAWLCDCDGKCRTQKGGFVLGGGGRRNGKDRPFSGRNLEGLECPAIELQVLLRRDLKV